MLSIRQFGLYATTHAQHSSFASTIARRYNGATHIKNVTDLPIADNNRDIGLDYDTIINELNKHRPDDTTGLLRMRSLQRDIICPYTDSSLKQCAVKGINNGTTDWPKAHRSLLGENSVMVINGASEEHRQIRKILNPLFMTNSELYSRFSILIQNTKAFIDQLIGQTNESDEYCNVHTLSKQWVWNISLSILFGPIDGSSKVYTKEFSEKFNQILCQWALGFADVDMSHVGDETTILGKALKQRDVLLKMIDELLKERKDVFENGLLDPHCVFYRLFKNLYSNKQQDAELEGFNRSFWDDMDVLTDTALILINASYDTTAASCNNIMYVLNKFPDEKIKLENELSSVVDNIININGDSDNYNWDEKTFDLINTNEYLDYFVSEVMRYIPTVRYIPKIFLKDEIINNVKIPANTTYELHNVGLSRCESLFSNPGEFLPERWDKNSQHYKKISNYSWKPFGTAPKTCLGWKLAVLELKVFAAMFTTQCDFTIDENNCPLAHSFFNFYDLNAKVYPKQK